MAREIEKLTALQVKRLAIPGKHPDGAGLYLQVSTSGAKSWLFRYEIDGRETWMGLGGLLRVSLKRAREKAQEARAQLGDGIAPLDHKRAQRAARKVQDAHGMTFKACAAAYIKSHRTGWKNEKHAQQWENTLVQHAYPTIGELPVAAIDTALVMKVLEDIWQTKTETASRVRGRIENILGWAKVRGYRTGDNPARWRDHLDQLLPARNDVQRTEHHAALPYNQVAGFMTQLRALAGVAARALEFTILTAARTGEVTGATWNEIDFDAKLWTVPGTRMKARKEHRKPLSARCIEILQEVQKLNGAFVFPGKRDGEPLSDMALLMTLRRMGRGGLTTHGFRSTFRDWAAEISAFPAEVAEMALAHVVADKVEAAYRRGDLLARRYKIMEDWAEFCARPPKNKDESSNVVEMRRKKPKAAPG